MGWEAQAPGSRVGTYAQSRAAISAFADAYADYVAHPDLPHRAEAEQFLVRAARACEEVGAVPGHAALDRWGVASLAFLHDEPDSGVTLSETSGSVRAALAHALEEYDARMEREHGRRYNPLLWVAHLAKSAVLLPVKLIGSLLDDD